MKASSEISDVLGAHLSPRDRKKVGSLLRTLLLSVGMRRDRGAGDDEAVALLRLIGGDSVDLAALDREVRAAAARARAAGVPDDAFPALAQAYARGIGRIVDAEAETVRVLLAGIPDEERAATLDEALSAALPVTSATFDVLHATLLRDALAEALSPGSLREGASAPAAIALVDLVSSTDYLAQAGPEETVALVDGLFEAGQLAAARGAVRPVKYVGDGVFFAGRDVEAVAVAALDALDHIAAELPIPARGGLAYGPVVRRAGDFFGMPMNLAQILTKAATPGTLLANAEAAVRLPAEMLARRRIAPRRHGGAREVVRAPA